MSKRKKIVLGIFVVVLIAAIGVGGYMTKVYFDIKSTASKVYTEPKRKKSEKRDQAIDLKKDDPFSVLLLGVDTGDLGRTEKGRSDTMIVVTINPQKKTTTLVSLERDTYAEIVGHNSTDKINHAYAFGGVDMAIATVEKLLDIPIDHYISMNMMGLESLVDAAGGVDVENTLEFTYSGTTFNKGTVHLNGKDALKFTRMRYDDPKGDYGRQERQRKVITAIVKKSMNIATITNYKKMLTAVQDNTKTDLSWDNFITIESNYREAFTTINSDHMQGVSASHNNDGVSYQDIPAAELDRVKAELKEGLSK